MNPSGPSVLSGCRLQMASTISSSVRSLHMSLFCSFLIFFFVCCKISSYLAVSSVADSKFLKCLWAAFFYFFRSFDFLIFHLYFFYLVSSSSDFHTVMKKGRILIPCLEPEDSRFQPCLFLLFSVFPIYLPENFFLFKVVLLAFFFTFFFSLHAVHFLL